MPDLISGFALVAVVLIVAGLTSGFVERAPISFPIIFLGLGFALGDHGLGVLSLGPEDLLLETVATLTLALVLCLEGVRIGNESVEGTSAASPARSECAPMRWRSGRGGGGTNTRGAGSRASASSPTVPDRMRRPAPGRRGG